MTDHDMTAGRTERIPGENRPLSKEELRQAVEQLRPEAIEKRSMEIIESEAGDFSHLSEQEKPVVKRVIHATADFEYLWRLKFSQDAVARGLKALRQQAVIVTDTNMAKAGINSAALHRLGTSCVCFMADEEVAKKAKEAGITRAAVSVDKAAEVFKHRKVIYVVGNAPTALLRLSELIEQGSMIPALVIGTPVGFVNVIQSKELIKQSGVPYIVADGRKGGSTVAAAICNALLYQIA